MLSFAELYPEVREGDVGVVTGRCCIPMGAEVRVEISPSTGKLAVTYSGLHWSLASGRHYTFKTEKKGYAKWIGDIE